MEASGPPAGHQYDYRERRSVLPFVPSTGRVLDVGCSVGGFGAALRARNPEQPTVGIEMSAAAAEQARDRFGQVLVGSFPADLPRDERFECIVFNDVLEHMIDPWEALRAAAAHLTPTGRVVASIPSVRYLPVLVRLVARGEWTYTETGTLDRTHLRFFTRKTMIDMFRTSAYVVEAVVPINPWHDRTWLRRVLPDDIACMQFVLSARPTAPTS